MKQNETELKTKCVEIILRDRQTLSINEAISEAAILLGFLMSPTSHPQPQGGSDHKG